MSNRDRTRIFIRSFQYLPALWDEGCPGYRDECCRESAYQILIKTMRGYDRSADRQTVMAELQRLRQIYQRRDKEHQYYKDLQFLRGRTPSDCVSSTNGIYDENDADDRSTMTLDADDTLDISDEEEEESSVSSTQIDEFLDGVQQKATDHVRPLAAVDYSPLGEVYAAELNAMDAQQASIACKIINKVLRRGRNGTLHTHNATIDMPRLHQ